MRRLSVSLLPAITAWLLSACAPGTTTTTVATTTTPAPTTTLAAADAMAQFRACLEARDVVVPDLPVDDSGRPDLGPLATANDISTNAFRSSLTECATILAANGVLDAGADLPLAHEVRKQLQRFATCMRESGVEEFPDPVEAFDGGGLPFPTIPIDDPELATAIEVCSTALGFAPLTG